MEQWPVTKPAYSIPTMAEIRALPWNGYRCVSTFSGGGGSCTGYAMAGFKVVWASEFVEEAARSYRANHPNAILDTRDIRTVQPQVILDAIGCGVGEIDLYDGSPPCSSFSTAGKRERGWGKAHKYSTDRVQRTDDLFAEYIRLLRGLRPKVFIAENVSGMLKGTAKGVFKEVLRELSASGYRVEARLVDASWCGVPQARQRVIFQGVRSDLGLAPAFPKPLPYWYTLADALPHIRRVQADRRTSTAGAGSGTVVDVPLNRPIQTVTASGLGNDYRGDWTVEADAWIDGYAIAGEWDKLKPGEQSERYFQLVKPALDKPSPTLTATGGQTGAAGPCHPIERRKFSIPEVKQLCSFPPDYVLTGTFAQKWERCGRSVPPLMMKRIAETVRDEVLGRIAK
jgi:DNA (cytosine-5)-methyltransferase 1